MTVSLDLITHRHAKFRSSHTSVDYRSRYSMGTQLNTRSPAVPPFVKLALLIGYYFSKFSGLYFFQD